MNSPSATNDNVIEAFDLVRHYGDRIAVAGITFSIKRGEVFGFLGPNGSGKTTTIRMLCGILPPTSGSGKALGLDIVRDSELIKSHIGYMSQKFSLYDDLTVRENLEFYAGVHALSSRQRKIRTKEMLELAELSDRENQFAGELSGGWKQRLALTCALIHEPEIIFLDEPTAGVDPVSRRKFWEMIRQISESGATILVTTHYMDEAERFDRLLFLDRGELIASGTPEEIKSRHFRHRLWEIYCSPLMTGADILRGQSQVLNVSVYGSSLHVTTAVESTDSGLLLKALSDRSVEVQSIGETKPTLEDVFVQLTSVERGNSGKVN